MLDLGYDSTQSYYIKCPTCVIAEGRVPLGVDGTNQPEKKIQKVDTVESIENTDDIEVEEEPEEERVMLHTQTQRLFWEELPDSEEEREKQREKLRQKKKGKKGANKTIRKKHKGNVNDDDDEEEDDDKVSKGKPSKSPSKAKGKSKVVEVHDDDDDDEDEEEEDELTILCSKLKVPRKLTMVGALDLLLAQEQAQCLTQNYNQFWNEKQLKNLSSIDLVRAKIDSNRFRSAQAFIAEVRSVVESLSKLPVPKDNSNSNSAPKIVQDAKLLLGLFNRKISEKIIM
jgi:hypothetical protein